MPLFKVSDSVEHCNFFELSDGDAYTMPNGQVCCYGQESEKNDTCPPDTIEYNNQCIPIYHKDNNDSGLDSNIHDCPLGFYYDTHYEICKAIISNSTSPNSGFSSGSDSNPTFDNRADINNDGIIDDNEKFGGEMSPDDYQNGLTNFATDLLSKVNDLLDSYVLIQLPISVSGSCSSQLKVSFSLLGRSYSIDLSRWFSKLDSYNSVIYGLIMFMFGLSGVLIVSSSSKVD